MLIFCRLPVTVIRYKVKVKSSVINTVSARRPNDNTLIQQLKIQYSTNQILLYTGSGPFFQLKDSLKFYVKGPGPVESQIKHMEEAILSAHNNTCGKNCRSSGIELRFSNGLNLFS